MDSIRPIAHRELKDLRFCCHLGNDEWAWMGSEDAMQRLLKGNYVHAVSEGQLFRISLDGTTEYPDVECPLAK